MQLMALVCALAGTLTQPGEIAFVDVAAGNGGAVCIVNLDDGALRQIGPGQQDGPPQWSPDGEWLAFETASAEGRGLYLVRADGSDGRAAGTGAWRTMPSWSNDSTRLIYCSAPGSGVPGQVHVLDLNSGEEETWGSGAIGIVQPLWMPFSELMLALDPEKPIEVPDVDLPRFLTEAHMALKQVLARTTPDAFLAVRLLPDFAGSRASLRTDLVLVSKSVVLPWMYVADEKRAARQATVWGLTPNWRKHRFGPNAATDRVFGAYPLEEPGETSRIAFESNEGGDREIMILGRRGIANVSNHRTADWNPVWSPDGDNLAFESFRGGSRGIYNVYADTALVTPLAVAEDENCWAPSWSNDSRHLAFLCDRSGQAEVYLTQPQESKWKQLTTAGGAKSAPAWRPVRK